MEDEEAEKDLGSSGDSLESSGVLREALRRSGELWGSLGRLWRAVGAVGRSGMLWGSSGELWELWEGLGSSGETLGGSGELRRGSGELGALGSSEALEE